MKHMRKRTFYYSCFMTIITLVCAACIYSKANSRPDNISDSFYTISYIALASGIILSMKFNRSNIFYIFVTLIISEFLIISLDTDLSFYNVDINFIYTFTGAIIPINIFLFSSRKEKGILSSWGKVRIGIIVLEFISLWAFALGVSDNIIKDGINLNWISIKLVPLPCVISFMIILIFYIIRLYFRRLYKDVFYIGVVAAAFLGLFLENNLLGMPIFFSAAGIILLAAVIQESYSMAYIDELTGLPSRRALDEELNSLGGRYSIAMLDIDFFKKFNDKYGHDAGDEVLKIVSAKLRDVSGGGKAFRYGGEEFTIVFPKKRASHVIPHVEKVREQVSKSGFCRGKSKKGGNAKKIRVTVSGGVAERNDKLTTPSEVLKAADTALYRAKNKGRNCISK